MSYDGYTYHFSVDGNIIFLEDLVKRDCESIFDLDYMDYWRSLNRKYGLKVQLNIHGHKENGFSLREVPDRWKKEWQENASWLRLTFHHAEAPGCEISYADASYEKAKADYLFVNGEIARFAGEELVSPYTSIHHASGSREACRAWKDCGVKGLIAATWPPA